jgi:hypothetical protein
MGDRQETGDLLMAYSLQVDKLEDDGTIHVRHIFYGDTEKECYRRRDEHGSGCQAFGPALEEGKIIETLEEVDEIPEWEDDDEEG